MTLRDLLALARVDGPGEVYRMQRPTGLGKAIAVGGFALAHSMRLSLQRVVIAVLYLRHDDPLPIGDEFVSVAIGGSTAPYSSPICEVEVGR